MDPTPRPGKDVSPQAQTPPPSGLRFPKDASPSPPSGTPSTSRYLNPDLPPSETTRRMREGSGPIPSETTRRLRDGSGPPSTARHVRELRKHPRFKIEGVIPTVHVRGLLSSFGLGSRVKAIDAADLSEGGALIVVDRRVKPGTIVWVRLEFPKYSDKIESEAEVRWSFQDARNPEQFFIGVMFKGLGDEQAAKIAVMRRWFTSPEYRAKTTRRWVRPPDSKP
jgi:hypothetical protein